MSEVSFPRLSARTRNFRLGAPRSFTVSPDGSRVLFLRSSHGEDPANSLWCLETADATERCVVDAHTLGIDETNLPAEERARRERAREVAGGITGYSTDEGLSIAAFTVGGDLFSVSLEGDPEVRRIPTPSGVFDPRLSPTGTHVAYVVDGALHVALVGSGEVVITAAPAIGEQTVTWGVADFAAAEEMGRGRGFWWAPDGNALLATRVDNAEVAVWWIADPAHPESAPREHRYPAAGTANAAVSLWRLGLDGSRSEIEWDAAAYPYLATVEWAEDPLFSVQNREQTEQVIYRLAPNGLPAEVGRLADPRWVELVPGTPALTPAGLLTAADDPATDTRRLSLDGRFLSPAGWQIRSVISTDDSGVFATAADEAVANQVIKVGFDGTCTPITSGLGWNAAAGASTLVVASTSLDDTLTSYVVHRVGAPGSSPATEPLATIDSRAASHPFTPAVTLMRGGPRDLNIAVLFPRDHVSGSRRLPVIMAPYGGPHAQQTIASAASYSADQWLADQGFLVVVADGRGTPGRGPAWEKAIWHDVAGPVLDDQVSALEAVVEAFPDDADPGRVGIHGWSFGGYLAALAVLRRPDVFHAAVAGAPVTEWRLYDTHYTERYLGNPAVDPEPYERTSLLPLAADLSRPLMLIHGLADDNVVAANSLQLSGALMQAGRAHTFLPLAGVTHMTPQEEVAENLMLLQVDFLRSALG